MERARSVPTVQGGAYVFKISSQPPTSHESRMQRADVAISRAKTVLALREISHIISETTAYITVPPAKTPATPSADTTQARKSEFEPLPVAEEEQQEIGGGGERETEMQRNNSGGGRRGGGKWRKVLLGCGGRGEGAWGGETTHFPCLAR
eukprot:764623-Hanusia_phi.AAC.2